MKEMDAVRELYTNQLFHEWAEKERLMPVETHFISKYLTEKSKRVVEAGTGGGRIIFSIETMGFTNLDAFDFVPRFISLAQERARVQNSRVNFVVADACQLNIYSEETFDYLIYLQQVLCSVPEDQLAQGMKEAFRIAKKGSIAIFSFLNWRSRVFNPLLSVAVNSLKWLRRERVSKYYLPYLRLDDHFNRRLFHRNQPLVYWGTKDDIVEKLTRVGFTIIDVNTEKELGYKSTGIYVVCTKP
jgi:ubiquinone/menaquinone biosynthesis C-methylase UbiE